MNQTKLYTHWTVANLNWQDKQRKSNNDVCAYVCVHVAPIFLCPFFGVAAAAVRLQLFVSPPKNKLKHEKCYSSPTSASARSGSTSKATCVILIHFYFLQLPTE